MCLFLNLSEVQPSFETQKNTFCPEFQTSVQKQQINDWKSLGCLGVLLQIS
jgi:hypothetical protein